MIACASSPCSAANADQTFSTTAVESTSVPSMSNSTARAVRVALSVVPVVTGWPAVVTYWPWSWYFASVSAFCGFHQPSLSRYQAMVDASPDSKSEYFGAQPSSVRSFVESIA
jgi:hypothetical protein